jgi:hypothetical protein
MHAVVSFAGKFEVKLYLAYLIKHQTINTQGAVEV